MSNKNDYFHIGEKGFFPAWFSKLLFTLISVKFWGLVVSITLSTHLLLIEKIEAQQWVVFNTTIWGLIFGMKEVFRIAENKNQTDQNIQQAQQPSINIPALPKEPTSTTDNKGKEIVGADPS
jgi:hypothetical protein